DVGPTRRGRGAGAGQAAVGEAPVEGDLQPVAQALLTDVVRGERFEAVNQVGGRDERQQTGVRVGGQVQPVVGVRVDLAQRLVEELAGGAEQPGHGRPRDGPGTVRVGGGTRVLVRVVVHGAEEVGEEVLHTVAVAAGAGGAVRVQGLVHVTPPQQILDEGLLL